MIELELRGARAGYGHVEALHGVDLVLAAGRLTALLGPNGAGKTTMLSVLAGLVPLRAGSLAWQGKDVSQCTPADRVRLGMLLVPEGRGTFPGLSVQENLRMAVRRVGTPDQRKSAIEHAYDMFPRLAERRNQRAGTLSGGEQQMLALARALAVPPKVIIADEMSLGLAPLVVNAVFESIEQAAKNGVTIVLIEQFVHRALGLASQCVILKQGSVAWTGPSENARQEVLDRYLGESADAMA